MGIRYTLNLINPDRFEEMSSEIMLLDHKNADKLKELYIQKGLEIEDDFEEWYSEVFSNGEEEINVCLSSWLNDLISEKSWELYKSYTLFSDIFKSIPTLKNIARYFEYDRFDINPPEQLLVPDGKIIGIWSAAELADIDSVVKRYDTKDKLRSLIEKSPSLFDKILGKDKRIKRSIETWSQDNIWEFWQEIREAVITTVEKKWYLGLEQY